MICFAPIFDFLKSFVSQSGFWTLLGVIIAGYIASRNSRKLKMGECYAEVIGLKNWLKQLYLSRFEALLYSDYHEEKNRIKKYESPIDFEESKRWMQKSENLVFKISESERELAKIIGSIFHTFKIQHKDKASILALLNHPVPILQSLVSKCSTVDELEKLKIRLHSELSKLVEKIFDETFDPVIQALEKML